jgi:hypothetical protein
LIKSWFSSSVMTAPINTIAWIIPLPSHALFTFFGRIKTGMLPFKF